MVFSPTSSLRSIAATAAAAAQQTLTRQVQITTSPRPRNIAESRLILTALQKFGGVVTFRHLRVSMLLDGRPTVQFCPSYTFIRLSLFMLKLRVISDLMLFIFFSFSFYIGNGDVDVASIFVAFSFSHPVVFYAVFSLSRENTIYILSTPSCTFPFVSFLPSFFFKKKY